MRLAYYWKLKRLVVKQNDHALVAYRGRLSDPYERELCDIALAALYFSRRENSTAHSLFGKAHAFVHTRHENSDEYLRLFSLVYISLLRRNLEAATTYAQQGRALRIPFFVRSIFPMPDLEDKVLYQNTIEAVG